ncbi:hypothetical protein ACLOJK_025557 [Asimina triloba]
MYVNHNIDTVYVKSRHTHTHSHFHDICIIVYPGWLHRWAEIHRKIKAKSAAALTSLQLYKSCRSTSSSLFFLLLLSSSSPRRKAGEERKKMAVSMVSAPAHFTPTYRESFFSSHCRWSHRWPSPPPKFSGGKCPVVVSAAMDRTLVIGLAADSGCGKSTFMRRLTSVFGGVAEPPKGGNPDSNTLISDTTTVICLDDYHSLDRHGRKELGITALHPRANNFDLMYQQVKYLKEGIAVEKPIYNHVTGLIDSPELIKPPKILIIEGLHPM